MRPHRASRRRGGSNLNTCVERRLSGLGDSHPPCSLLLQHSAAPATVPPRPAPCDPPGSGEVGSSGGAPEAEAGRQLASEPVVQTAGHCTEAPAGTAAKLGWHSPAGAAEPPARPSSRSLRTGHPFPEASSNPAVKEKQAGSLRSGPAASWTRAEKGRQAGPQAAGPGGGWAQRAWLCQLDRSTASAPPGTGPDGQENSPSASSPSAEHPLARVAGCSGSSYLHVLPARAPQVELRPGWEEKMPGTKAPLPLSVLLRQARRGPRDPLRTPRA